MWTLSVLLVATNIVVAEQTMPDEDACRAAAYAAINPGVTYADCSPVAPPPINGRSTPVIVYTITDKESPNPD